VNAADGGGLSARDGEREEEDCGERGEEVTALGLAVDVQGVPEGAVDVQGEKNGSKPEAEEELRGEAGCEEKHAHSGQGKCPDGQCERSDEDPEGVVNLPAAEAAVEGVGDVPEPAGLDDGRVRATVRGEVEARVRGIRRFEAGESDSLAHRQHLLLPLATMG
jgi:hypothetical protein